MTACTHLVIEPPTAIQYTEIRYSHCHFEPDCNYSVFVKCKYILQLEQQTSIYISIHAVHSHIKCQVIMKELTQLTQLICTIP